MHFNGKSTLVLAVLGTCLAHETCMSSFGQAALSNESASPESRANAQSLRHSDPATQSGDTDRQNKAHTNSKGGKRQSVQPEKQSRRVTANQNPTSLGWDDEFAILPRNSLHAGDKRRLQPGESLPASTPDDKRTEPHSCNLPANVRSLVRHCNDVGDFGPSHIMKPRSDGRIIPWRARGVKQLAPSN